MEGVCGRPCEVLLDGIPLKLRRSERNSWGWKRRMPHSVFAGRNLRGLREHGRSADKASADSPSAGNGPSLQSRPMTAKSGLNADGRGGYSYNFELCTILRVRNAELTPRVRAGGRNRLPRQAPFSRENSYSVEKADFS